MFTLPEMKFRHVLALVILGLLPGCSTPTPQQVAKPIFNGRDLTGWVVVNGGDWTVEEGVLVGRNGRDWSTNPAVSGSWLRTEREYGDFVLELEYTIQGNSGVFLRSGLERNPAFTGYEMQILADRGRPPSKGSAGGLYDVIAATKNLSRPAGEWNQVRITYQGKQVRIEWNGELVLDYPTADRSTRGYIGLQNHDDRSVVKFRNLRLKEL